MTSNLSDANLHSSDSRRFKLSLGLFVAPMSATLVYWLSISQGDTIAGAMAVTVFAAILWFTEALPLPVTAILIPVGLAAMGVFESTTAFNSFGNPVLFLVLGGYALAVAVEVNHVDRWLARHMLSMAGTHSLGVLSAFTATSAVLSMFISNTATTALLLPVALGILRRHKADENLSRVILLGVAYGASIGGVATLTGSSPNAIAAGLLDMGFFEWLKYGLPVSVAMLVLTIPVLWWTFKPEQQRISITLSEEAPLSDIAKRTLWVICITVLMWLIGPALASWLHLPPSLFNSTSVSCMAIALLIFTRCVDWKSLEGGVHWGVLLLLGGGLSLGRALTESGAADWLAGLMATSLGELPFFVLLISLAGIAVFATELISNTAMTAKLAPIVLGMATQLGLHADSLVVLVAISTSMAFMLPVATPPNALVHATGQVAQKDMMRSGLRLNVVAILIIAILFYFGIAG